VKALFESVLKQEKVDAFETVRIRKGGERVYVWINAVPLSDGSGSPTCVAQIVSDLTERKRADEASRQMGREILAVTEGGRITRRSRAAADRPTETAAPAEKLVVQTANRQGKRTEQRLHDHYRKIVAMKKLFATLETRGPLIVQFSSPEPRNWARNWSLVAISSLNDQLLCGCSRLCWTISQPLASVELCAAFSDRQDFRAHLP